LIGITCILGEVKKIEKLGIMKIPKYSILITTYNTIDTIRHSLESILSQIDDEFEVIVVDSYSTDGTLEYLKDLANRGKIRLITQKCSRGVGRQIALQQARAKYVIARVDMDEIYNPIIKKLAEYYVRKSNKLGEFVLYAGQIGGFYFATKPFMLRQKGWKDLQWGENYELNKRLIDMNRLWVCRVNLPKYHIKPIRSRLGKLRISYITYRDALRMGLRFSVLIKGINWTVPNQFARIPRYLNLLWAWIVHWTKSRYDTFKTVSWVEYYVDERFGDKIGKFEKLNPQNILPIPPEFSYPPKQTIYTGTNSKIRSMVEKN
jgi:glycosyltransferase involved in cell wall biosynthesis